MAILLFGDQIQFKINSWIPISNRFQRDYSSEVVEYVTYNEEKTARKIVRGLKEKYTITLYDWSIDDLITFNAIETSTVKNIITFYPSLDADTTKVSYFEYYIDPFNKFLKIEITPVFLLTYSTLPELETYSNITQVFGNTIVYSQPVLGAVTLPRKTVCKISVDYFLEPDRISITGKIHREYKYKTTGLICKKIIFTGTSFDITNDLYNSLRVYQGISETDFEINENFYLVIPVLQFMPILKNQWKLDFKCEVQYLEGAPEIQFLQDIADLAMDANFTLLRNLDFNKNSSYNQLDPDWQTKKLAWTTRTGWNTIGTESAPYTGTFDGDNFKISNLYMNNILDIQGLFGSVSGTIKNLELEDVYLETTGTNLGAIAGNVGGTGLIENCKVSGNVYGSAETSTYIGGLVGALGEGCQVSKCSSSANVSGNIMVGGLVGLLSAVGNTAIIINSYCTGDVFASYRFAGGLFGYGYANPTTNCYSTGVITGNQYVGGYCGQSNTGTAHVNCYWDVESSEIADDCGNGTPTGIIGKLTSEMKYPYSDNIYTDWNTPTHVWEDDIVNGYPVLGTGTFTDGSLLPIRGVYLANYLMADLTDEVAGGDNLTNTGAVQTTGVKGVSNTAYLFDATENDLITIPATGRAPNNSKWWVLFWVKTTDVGLDPDIEDPDNNRFAKRIISCMGQDPGNSISLSIDHNGMLNFGLYYTEQTGSFVEATTFSIYSECVINDDEWHLIFLSWDNIAQSVIIKVDDNATMTEDYSLFLTGQTNFLMYSPDGMMNGYRFDGDPSYKFPCSGKMAQFRVFETAPLGGYLGTYNAEKP